MTKIYLTRHGETVWNRQRRFQGHKNSELTDKGILAAELLADRIEDIELDYIVSSPLLRAYNTAEIARGNKDVQIIKYDGLKEINLGEFEGMSYVDIKSKHTELLAEIEKDPFNNRYPNGENLQEFYKRVVKVFTEVVDKHRNKTTLIVAHGGTLKCIEAYIRKFKLSSDWMGNVVKNCSLSYIEIDENNEIKEIFYNDTKHLEGSAVLN
ncbi:MAG: histidine phosphatase family protein [Tissierellia bacterium]|jgi:probable phosphoglycerate mutase|nr:histidine phosphatase family protein [Tissierellia bacterium]MDD3227306.1 histidine phosphatase family protein [Tissierellia bacterium]MDD3751461.1 histidine phosphatase family protein [Tissierellia bacterium]MDD4046892.1 histidine phosphatase family protein [Tissierellia bacterium]MDD4678841.1 histidine phosphatase family protein [Tissierellia bacterium]